jgi:small subunit ribosomal protein S13
VQADIRRKVEIGSYEGIRHRRGLPGADSAPIQRLYPQGPKRTVAGKKKAGKK